MERGKREWDGYDTEINKKDERTDRGGEADFHC